MKKNLFVFTFLLVLFIAVLNEMAVAYYFYWKIWWFDILMHFLGGLWVGLSALWIYLFSGYFKNIKKDKFFLFLFCFLSVFVVGVSWEIFEFLIGEYFADNYVEDTILDIIMDLVGAGVAFATILFLNKKDYKNNV